MTKLSLAALVLMILPSTAHAIPGRGTDIQWNDCVGGPAALNNVNFNCVGAVDRTYHGVCNFKINQNVPHFAAITAHFRLMTYDAPQPLAPFWHYEVGGCQRLGGGSPDGIAISDVMPANAYCAEYFTDPWGGDGSGGVEAIVSYSPDNPTPGRALMVVGVARVGGSTTLNAGDNYFAFSVSFNNRNRTSCAGCSGAGGLEWIRTILESDDGSPPIELVGVGPDKGNTCASFNGGISACLCACTPVLNRTWGTLKAMYR